VPLVPRTEIEALALFTLAVIALVALDVAIVHRKARRIRMRQAVLWTAFWIGLALAFGCGVFLWRGRQAGLEFITAYVLEESLSVDNLFVFSVLLFSYRIAAEQQHRVLGWGIYGALVTRAVFILAGVFLISRFHWVLYLFGAFLLFTGVRLLTPGRKIAAGEHNWAVRLAQRFFPVATDAPAGKFFVRREGRRYATPLLLALATIEATDILFAFDSIPAVFGVTHDPFIAYTSNILAVVGMRSLYFVLAAAVRSFRYLERGVAAILIFIGAGMLAAHWVRLPVVLSLVVISGILAVAVAASVLRGDGAGAGDKTKS
jgi:tellurite resistance protein TerC